MSQRGAHARRGGGRLWRAYFQWRYAILFYSLLFTLAVGPLCSALGFRANLLELFLAINLLVAVLPIGVAVMLVPSAGLAGIWIGLVVWMVLRAVFNARRVRTVLPVPQA